MYGSQVNIHFEAREKKVSKETWTWEIQRNWNGHCPKALKKSLNGFNYISPYISRWPSLRTQTKQPNDE